MKYVSAFAIAQEQYCVLCVSAPMLVSIGHSTERWSEWNSKMRIVHCNIALENQLEKRNIERSVLLLANCKATSKRDRKKTIEREKERTDEPFALTCKRARTESNVNTGQTKRTQSNFYHNRISILLFACLFVSFFFFFFLFWLLICALLNFFSDSLSVSLQLIHTHTHTWARCLSW